MAIEYASSKVVHRTLRRELAPWFLANGWKKRAGPACAFLLPVKSKYWCLWVQVSQYGGKLDGNSFTLNLSKQDAPDSRLEAGTRVMVETFGKKDREAAFEIVKSTYERIPDPLPSDPVHDWAKLPGYQGEQWRERLANLRKPNPKAWKPGIDVWLHYYSVDDLTLWANFLAPRWPHLLRLAVG